MSSSKAALGVPNDVHGDATCPPATLEGAGDDTLDGALWEVDVCRRGRGLSAAEASAGGASRATVFFLALVSVVQWSSTRCKRSRTMESASSVVLGTPRAEIQPTSSSDLIRHLSGGAEFLTKDGPSRSEPFSSWPVEDRRILCRETCIYHMLASHDYIEPIGVQYMVSQGDKMLGQ